VSFDLPVVLGGRPLSSEPVPLVRPTVEDVPGLVRELTDVLESGLLTNGPRVRRLEEVVAERLGIPHVVAVASCTTGLMLTYQGLGATGTVVLPSFTFAASAHAIVWAGGTPTFADVERGSLCLDPTDADQALDGAVALSATHVYGRPCSVEVLEDLAARRGIPLVLDAAHALGSTRRGRPIGTFGTAEVFSLSPTKVVVGGEGGLVTTKDAGLAEAVRLGRDYGNPGDYDCRFPGLNARMSELHAAVALSSLARLDDHVAYRNVLVTAFKEAVHGIPGIGFQHVDETDVSTYKDLTLAIDPEGFGLNADQVGRALKAERIDSRHYYSPPIHRQKAYAAQAPQRELPVTDAVASQVITVPLSSHQTMQTMRTIADTIVRLHHHAPAVVEALP
jgi:dTDP-4-amino-4,6-dideoxygalactose transaminase